MNSWDATDLANLDFDATSFCGVARLFPLPNLVLYPHVMQPLHIFEERYLEMLEDAMDDDRLIAMATLEPGWEDEYDSRPPISEYGCLGKVVAHHRLADGQCNVLLLGVGRVRIVRELEPLRSYRQAKVELVEDCYDFPAADDADRLQQTLLAAFRKHLPCVCQLPEQLEDLLSRHLPLGLMTDLAAYALPLDLAIKQQLLAERRVSVRAETLLSQIQRGLKAKAASAHELGFPPPFSMN